MPHQSQLQSMYDPHGYVPIVIDERCLDDNERHDAILVATNQPEDWNSYLTPKELSALDAIQKEVDRSSGYFYGESPLRRENNFQAARLGMYRAYARKKYAW